MSGKKQKTVRIHSVVKTRDDEIVMRGNSGYCNPETLYIDYSIGKRKKKVTDVRGIINAVIVEFEDDTKLIIKGIE